MKKNKTIATPIQLPTLELLNTPFQTRGTESDEKLKRNKERIAYTLNFFGIQYVSINTLPGPVISTYIIALKKGTKKIERMKELLEEYIVFSQTMEGVSHLKEIIFPLSIVGTRLYVSYSSDYAINIEIPNENPQFPSIREAVESNEFQQTKMELPILIGELPNGEYCVSDLCKTKRGILITGNAENNWLLSTIILSLLYKKKAEETKLILLGSPKKDASLCTCLGAKYIAQLPRDNQSFISKEERINCTLQSLCQEINHRLNKLNAQKAHNIQAYNKRLKEQKSEKDFMPYIVVIVQEYSELIKILGKDFELSVCLLAQQGKTVGIYIIMSTQQVTTEIVTGSIKANFPTRMAFATNNEMNSRIMIDTPEANKLLPNGHDMLYRLGNKLQRIQTPSIQQNEIERIVYYTKRQTTTKDYYELPRVEMTSQRITGNVSRMDKEEVKSVINDFFARGFKPHP